MCYQFFAKKVQFLPPQHAPPCFSNEFSQHSGSIHGRNPSMVIPLLANRDLTPMLLRGGYLHKRSFTSYAVENVNSNVKGLKPQKWIFFPSLL